MLDLSVIRSALPHGHPMLLVDRIEELDPGKRIVATKALTFGEPCYRDVPADAAASGYAYPASLLLESFGQAAALLWLLGSQPAQIDGEQVLMLVAARDCTIEGLAIPGDTVRHVACIDRIVGDNVFVEGASYVDDRRVASVGSMMAAIRPRSALQAAGYDTSPQALVTAP